MSNIQKNQTTQTELVTIPDNLDVDLNQKVLLDEAFEKVANLPSEIRQQSQVVIEVQGMSFYCDVINGKMGTKPPVLRFTLNPIFS